MTVYFYILGQGHFKSLKKCQQLKDARVCVSFFTLSGNRRSTIHSYLCCIGMFYALVSAIFPRSQICCLCSVSLAGLSHKHLVVQPQCIHPFSSSSFHLFQYISQVLPVVHPTSPRKGRLLSCMDWAAGFFCFLIKIVQYPHLDLHPPCDTSSFSIGDLVEHKM